jgi:ribosomal protein L28
MMKVGFTYTVHVNGFMYEVHSERKFRFNLKKKKYWKENEKDSIQIPIISTYLYNINVCE